MSAKPLPIFSEQQASLASNKSQAPWLTTLCIAAIDLATLAAVFAVSALGRHLLAPNNYHLRSYLELLPFAFLTVAGLALQGLYPGFLIHPAEEMRRIVIAASTTFLFLTCTTFLVRNGESYSRSVFLVTWAAGAPVLVLTRYLSRRALRKQPWWGVKALVLGSGPSARRVLRKLNSPHFGVRVFGVLSDSPAESWGDDLPPILGPLHLAPVLAKLNKVQYVVVAMPEKSQNDLRHVIQDYCNGFSHVLIVPDLPGLCSLNVEARDLGGEVGLELPQKLFHPTSFLLKRALDISFSATATLILSPLLVAIAVAVKLTSPGPILYRQLRYGRGGRTFYAFKFRTMVPRADAVLSEHLAKHPDLVLEWERDHKLKNDPRVTIAGKWLRRFSLDELPQLYNVLAGQMSLVGPRPIVKAEIAKYGREYRLYSLVLPGITGLWQVSGRNNTTYQERIAFDEFYVSNWSVWLDAYILIRTVKVVLTTEGAY